MNSPGEFINQLRRQARWLSESRKWIISEQLLKEGKIETAVDVGCGPGFIMKELSDSFGIRSTGIDLDRNMLESAQTLDLDVICANGHLLPFLDSAFDMVHCTFTLMWMGDPIKVLREMRRVSRKWVVCFAEPDYGARVDFPDSLSELPWVIAESIKRDGGDPYMGRKLRGFFSKAGMDPKIGVFDSVWSLEQLDSEFSDEWDYLSSSSYISEKVQALRPIAKESIDAKTRMQFTPIFYAIARV
jgi:ubiquinone/menaquinone biosynthesis C-methylase UbiE